MQKRNYHLGACIFLAVISTPLILGVIPPNDLYGFRLESDPQVWYEINSFSGWALLIAAIASASIFLLSPPRLRSSQWFLIAAIMGPVLLALVASIIYLKSIV